MGISVKAVRFDKYNIWVIFNNSRALGLPLTHFPKLISASQQQRNDFELSTHGIHWNALNEDLSIDEVLACRSDAIRYPNKIF